MASSRSSTLAPHLVHAADEAFHAPPSSTRSSTSSSSSTSSYSSSTAARRRPPAAALPPRPRPLSARLLTRARSASNLRQVALRYVFTWFFTTSSPRDSPTVTPAPASSSFSCSRSRGDADPPDDPMHLVPPSARLPSRSRDSELRRSTPPPATPSTSRTAAAAAGQGHWRRRRHLHGILPEEGAAAPTASAAIADITTRRARW